MGKQDSANTTEGILIGECTVRVACIGRQAAQHEWLHSEAACILPLQGVHANSFDTQP